MCIRDSQTALPAVEERATPKYLVDSTNEPMLATPMAEDDDDIEDTEMVEAMNNQIERTMSSRGNMNRASGGTSLLHTHREDDEEELEEEEDDLDNENSLRNIEKSLDRALSDVNHLTVDNLASSLGQAIMRGDLPMPEQERETETSRHPNLVTGRSDVVSLASTLANDLAHLVETMNLGDVGESLSNTDSLRPHSNLVARAAYAGAKNLSRSLGGVTSCSSSQNTTTSTTASAGHVTDNRNRSLNSHNPILVSPTPKELFTPTNTNLPDNRY